MVETDTNRKTEARETEAALLVALRDIDKTISDATDKLAFTADTPTLSTALCEAVALRNKFDAFIVELTGSAERAGVAPAAGLRTIGQFVASHTGAEPRATNADVRRARWLRDYDLFSAAFAGGDLSTAHVDYMRRTLTNYRTHIELYGAQQLLVDAARDCTFADFVTVCDYWLITIDPDGQEPQDQIKNTNLTLRKGRGGRMIIGGEADAVTGQLLQTALDHECRQLRQHDDETGIARTPGQRRLAALANLVARGAARQDGTVAAPLVNIVMSLEVAEWARNQHQDPSGDPVPVDAFDIDGRCEFIDGTPVHPTLVMAMLGLFDLAQPKLRRYIMDAKSRVLDVSHNARNFAEWQRTTSLIRSRGSCETPGCDAPFDWLQIDHIDPVNNGGPTSVDNAQTQCGPDNQAKAATTGHVPWRDKPPPTRHQHRPPNSTHRGDPDSDPESEDHEDPDPEADTESGE